MKWLGVMDYIIERGKTRTKKRGDGLHRHRIVPGYKGGEYVAENITLLTRQEHRIVHKIRYVLYGERSDLIASNWLSGSLTDEQVEVLKREGAVRGGKRAQEVQKRLKIGLHARPPGKPKIKNGLTIRDYWNNPEWAATTGEKIRKMERKEPINKAHFQCPGCGKEIAPSRLMRSHRTCLKKL